MRFKEGVSLVDTDTQVSRPILLAMEDADRLHRKRARREAVITSVLDGHHMVGSAHFTGNAFDLRIWYLFPLPLTPESFTKELDRLLGEDYDVVLEDTHIHVEFQPEK